MLAETSSDPVTVLFVDDDPDVLTTADLLLARRGYRMLPARGPAEALSQLAAHAVDVILLDLNFEPGAISGEEGLRLLEEILRHDPAAAVVVVTGHSGVKVAVAAMRAGARDFVMKPWSNSRLIVAIEDAVARRRADAPSPPPSSADLAAEDQSPILGTSPQIQRVRDMVARIAASPASVLITGEAGTGKSLIARAMHRQAPRSGAPLIVLDLASAPTSPADEARFIEREAAAAFAAAAGGDLLLDDIGGLSASLQGGLLALLAQRRSSGADDARLISATSKPRRDLEGAGGLRPDLLYRLSTLEIVVPPLRERREDIPVLADHFLRLYAGHYGRPLRVLSQAATETLTAGAWPGNVRALQQAIERGVILSDGAEVELHDLHLGGGAPEPTQAPTLAHSEKAMVEAALKRHGFNVSRAAQDLGLSRAALYRRMAKHGL